MLFNILKSILTLQMVRAQGDILRNSPIRSGAVSCNISHYF